MAALLNIQITRKVTITCSLQVCQPQFRLTSTQHLQMFQQMMW